MAAGARRAPGPGRSAAALGRRARRRGGGGGGGRAAAAPLEAKGGLGRWGGGGRSGARGGVQRLRCGDVQMFRLKVQSKSTLQSFRAKRRTKPCFELCHEPMRGSVREDMAMGQKLNHHDGTAGLIHVSIYQGSHFGYIFLTNLYIIRLHANVHWWHDLGFDPWPYSQNPVGRTPMLHRNRRPARARAGPLRGAGLPTRQAAPAV